MHSCSRCGEEDLTKFYWQVRSEDNTKRRPKKYCKLCQSTVKKELYYSSDKEKLRNRLWKSEHKELNRFYQSKRRALLKQRLPKWAAMNKIKEIYVNRPEGMHVDHIIPLQGVNVSGLHVPENLQYLPASENLKKHNNWEPKTSYWIG